ncbi:periplasmic glycine betaine/choline-binding (lipo)protein of an ABC-type transport system [Rothia mucilaginosa DY-18]|uniref:Periplasmic glycine betaine/choline-binding (Lipo)protein of an ABC-type transport system n=1 Tax=Rothia mucilaginosa (strain DY-18) TaxID=680646 RepID=D2NRW7_ROTMD|nr:glycine betaine ABC transporter substrate-binding protein [Rothia mucilaginosa]BAI64393.1 periplasmic glycine betaine/choline-binding (lipo)protein of an ABC-type transport system [Rothia mucilaginosa DY-18]
MNRLTLTRRAALTSLALMPLLAACGNNDATPQVDPSASSYGTLRIGYGALREMRAVAHVYARALRQVGYSVELVDTENSRATALRGLMVPSASSATLPDDEETGSTAAVEALDLVIDYSGDLLLYLTDDGKISPAAAQNERIAASVSASAQAAGVTLPPAATPTAEESTASAHATDATASPTASSTRSADPINLRAMSTTDMTNAISRILPEELMLLNGAHATNKDVLVTTRAVSARHKLNSLAHLREVQSSLTFSIPTGYSSGTYGVDSLRSLYRYRVHDPKIQDDPAERVKALTSDTVQVTLLHSSDSAIEENRLVTLEDPSTALLQQQLVPIIRRTLPDSARTAINRVSSTLDTGNLSFLLRLTSGSNPIADDDAAQFILDHPRK